MTTLRLPGQATFLTCRCTAFEDTLGRHVLFLRSAFLVFWRQRAPLNTFGVQVFAVAGCSEARYATGGGDDKAFLWSVRAPSFGIACSKACYRGACRRLPSAAQLNESGATQAVELAGHRDSVAAVAFRRVAVRSPAVLKRNPLSPHVCVPQCRWLALGDRELGRQSEHLACARLSCLCSSRVVHAVRAGLLWTALCSAP